MYFYYYDFIKKKKRKSDFIYCTILVEKNILFSDGEKKVTLS